MKVDLRKLKEENELINQTLQNTSADNTRLVQDKAKLQKEWDALNMQVQNLRNVLEQSEHESARNYNNLKNNYINIIDDKDTQLKEVLNEKERIRD